MGFWLSAQWAAGQSNSGLLNKEGPFSQQELLNGFEHPSVIFNPGEKFNAEARKYQGIPTIERAPGGRLWAAWYAGPIHEDRYNFAMAATSGDDGKTWSGLKLVVDPDGDGPLRASDPCLWQDPAGRLWLFWWMNGMHDGQDLKVTLAIVTENPDDENPVWTEPRALFPGVMLNKPIVNQAGEWLMPAAIWKQDGSCRMMVSKDSGKTWALRGTANVPEPRRNCDEPMIVERNDGSLMQLIRTSDFGIGQSLSTDGGATWTEAQDYLLDATSRFHFRKLNSGNLLLIKHGPLDERIGRHDMTAYLSKDEGKTWLGGLMLDERKSVSYPDATQAPDGTIYAIYDWNRADEKHILMSTFTEQDILDGAFNSDAARSRVLINYATGYNSKPWNKRNAENKKKELSSLRSNANGIAFDSGSMAAMAAPEASVQTVKINDPIFSNRDYTFHEQVPAELHGAGFVFSTLEQTRAVCVQSGTVYVITPAPDRNRDSVATALLQNGFFLTALPEFILFTPPNGNLSPANACSVYRKEVKKGETVEFGKWGVLVCSTAAAAAPVPENSSAQVRVACIGDSITYGHRIEDRELNSYPAQLGALLGSGYQVENFGKNGATVLKKGNVPYWTTAEFKPAHDFNPDIVVIMLGTNDSKPMNWEHRNDFVADYMALIEEFRSLSSSPEIIVCRPVPAFGNRNIRGDVIENEIIPLIDEAVRKTGVQMIDLHAALSGQADMFPDLVHPDQNGARLIAETVCAALSEKQ
jgi:lysophospholipase L1-like esterase